MHRRENLSSVGVIRREFSEAVRTGIGFLKHVVGQQKGTRYARLSMSSEEETKHSLERNDETPQRKT